MNKQQLLQELWNNTYVKLQPSPIAGIGVFAIRDIPQGCRDMFSVNDENKEEWINISRAEVAAMPDHSKDLVENYCLYDADHYYVPAEGFKKIDISLFLNHFDKPNIISINDGEFFEAIQPIKKGEELVIDYGEIVGDE